MNVHRKLDTNGVIVRTCATVILAIALGSASAETNKPRYTVAVISDTAYGEQVLKEDYKAAIARLEGRQFRGIKGFYAATNLCVAYMKTGDVESAQSICDSAVLRIRDAIDSERSTFGTHYRSQAYRRFLAMALSNRGVAHVLAGSPELARADFRDAMETSPKIRVPEVNLARLAATAPGA
jgi:tetratricopeptide (TPR) repeat protein